MRKTSLLIIAILAVTFGSFANDELLNDSEKFRTEFSEINKVEAFMQANPDASLESIAQTNPELLENISLEAETNLSATKGEGLPGNIPAFVWGCCLSVLGLGIVYFTTDNDKTQVKKALFGCLVGGAVGGIGCLVLNLAGGSSYYYW